LVVYILISNAVLGSIKQSQNIYFI